MATIYREDDLVMLEIDELETEPCIMGKTIDGGERVHAGTEGGVRWTCPDCHGIGMVKTKVVNTIRLHLRPMDYKLKLRLMGLTGTQNGQEITDSQLKSVESVRHTVKDIEGAKLRNGNDYKLEFIDGDKAKGLTDKCVSDLFNMEQSSTIVKGCIAFIAGIPTTITRYGIEDKHTRFVLTEPTIPN